MHVKLLKARNNLKSTDSANKPANEDAQGTHDHKAEEALPSREEAESAVKTLLRYIGENPAREGLIETPARFVRAFDEFFSGYTKDPTEELQKTFEEIEGYDDFVLVKNIEFVAHCEHHIVPITGIAHIAYWPENKIVGISKLARIVDIFAKRLVSQETMTQQIVQTIYTALECKGVAIIIDADHQCMSIRGVNKSASSTVTSNFTGIFQDNPDIKNRFLSMIKI